jgi:hypothetical protein
MSSGGQALQALHVSPTPRCFGWRLEQGGARAKVAPVFGDRGLLGAEVIIRILGAVPVMGLGPW